ncbi:MAG: hypothetical protein IJV14_06390 [Lachnospiraceae bacterium]|nr:hypothetical protein [Lachnospiraceae bacterium]
MVVLSSSEQIEKYLKRFHIQEHFSCDPAFSLRRYLPGELLTSPFEEDHAVQFIVDGDVILYDMPTEDSVAGVDSPFYRATLIGEAELINPNFQTFFVEAKTEVYSLALPLSEYREKLLNDNTFLRYVCRMLSEKLSDATSTAHKLPLREQLMRYINAAGEGGEIRDITHLSHLLHVSTRQLARTLHTLCEEGILEHSKKGVYLIRQANSMER